MADCVRPTYGRTRHRSPPLRMGARRQPLNDERRAMAVTPLRDILKPAFEARYGVPAINIVNDLSMESVLAGAVEARSPIILQTSVKTVRSITAPVLFAMWKAMTAGIEVPVALHLDHCPSARQVEMTSRSGQWSRWRAT